MQKFIWLVFVLSFILSACASPTAAPTATTTATVTVTATYLPSPTPTPSPTVTPTSDPFAGLEYNLAISLGGDFEGYAAAVDDEGQLVAVNGPEGNRLEPNEAGLFKIDDRYYTWEVGEDEVGELLEVPLPEGTTGEVRLDPVEGVNYLYALDESGQALWRWDVATLKYDTVEKRWRRLNLTPFSEYHQPTYEVEYTYESEDGKISFPLYIGLSKLPVTKVFFKEPMVKLMGEQWLLGCFYRYTEHMGNDVTFDEYVDLVKQGKGQIEMVYRDERSGQNKKGTIDPRTGFSVMITGKNDLPLKIKADSRYPSTYQITVNGTGQPVLVFNYNLDMLEHNYQIGVGENEYTPSINYVLSMTVKFLSAINYWADISWTELSRGGQLFGMDYAALDEFTTPAILAANNIDLTKETETELVSVEYERER